MKLEIFKNIILFNKYITSLTIITWQEAVLYINLIINTLTRKFV